MINQLKVRALEKKIKDTEEQIAFCNSAIILCTEEQNSLELEIDSYERIAVKLEAIARDLRAELADTV